MAGDEVTGATTFRIEQGLDAGPVFGVMTETIRPRRHRRRPARPARERAAPAAGGTLDGIEDGTLQARAAARRRASRCAEDHRRGRPGRLVRSPRCGSTGWSAAAPRRRAPGRPSAASGSSSARCAGPDAARAAPLPAAGADRRGRERRPRRHRHARVGSARSSRRARSRCRPPTGRAACASSRGSRSRDPDRHSRSGRRRGAPRGRGPATSPAARRTPPAGSPSTSCAPSTTEDAYANLVLPAAAARGAGSTGRDAGVRHGARLRHAARRGAPTTR